LGWLGFYTWGRELGGWVFFDIPASKFALCFFLEEKKMDERRRRIMQRRKKKKNTEQRSGEEEIVRYIH